LLQGKESCVGISWKAEKVEGTTSMARQYPAFRKQQSYGSPARRPTYRTDIPEEEKRSLVP